VLPALCGTRIDDNNLSPNVSAWLSSHIVSATSYTLAAGSRSQLGHAFALSSRAAAESMNESPQFHVARGRDDSYIVERYVMGRRESEGPFATRALAQARAEELNGKTRNE